VENARNSDKKISPNYKRYFAGFTSNTWGLAEVSISKVLDKIETTAWQFRYRPRETDKIRSQRETKQSKKSARKKILAWTKETPRAWPKILLLNTGCCKSRALKNRLKNMKSVFVVVMSACIFDYVLNDWGLYVLCTHLHFYKIMETYSIFKCV
jgi:hypothetical protein